MKIDPKLDLVLERVIDVKVADVWKAWTTPATMPEWFCPKPWTVQDAEMDLRPGGIFKTVMVSPAGEKYPNMGCVLEVEENRKLVWTDALLPDFRPAAAPISGAGLMFTAKILLESQGNKTKYTAIAMHRSEEDRKTHADMGFQQGWGICLDQLVEMVKSKGKK